MSGPDDTQPDPAAVAAVSLVDRERRRLGSRTCGPLALGCWRLTDPDPGRAADLVEAALDLGIDLVDTADVYGLDWGGSGWGSSERILGAAFAMRPGLRDRLVLATKGGIVPGVPYLSDPGYLVAACEASLRRIGVDRVDLYQVHRPDPYTHPGRVAEALSSLIERGLVGAVGVSNHTPAQTAALLAHLPAGLVSTQPEWSLAHLDPIHDGTTDLCIERGLVPLAWSPLAGGRVATGDGVRPELVGELQRLAEREEVGVAAVAIAFLLAHPSRPVVILGSQRAERLADLARASEVHLDRRDVYDLIVAATGTPLP